MSTPGSKNSFQFIVCNVHLNLVMFVSLNYRFEVMKKFVFGVTRGVNINTPLSSEKPNTCTLIKVLTLQKNSKYQV